MIATFQKNSLIPKTFNYFFKRLKQVAEIHRCSTMSSNSSLVAVCQLNNTSDREKNFEACKDLISAASKCQAKMVFLPECFDHVGESKEQAVQLGESLDGPLISKFKKLAEEKKIWLSLGGFHEKGSGPDSKRVSNAHIIINDKGVIASVYRKIHMFDINVPGGVRLSESEYTIPGREVMAPVETPVGKVGLGICYDLRFPEFSLSLVNAGAEILTYPSTFTQATGMAHWEPLLRSRAIECQSYVIAAAQTGRHNPKRASYGHAMIVDPWGCVISCCSDGVGIAFAEINLDYVYKIRSQMPVSLHRHSELYGSIPPAKSIYNSSEPVYKFGTIELLPEYLFYKTQHSIAFVNKKCVLPGHVLVCPIRCARRFSELSTFEVADLFHCVQTVQKVLEQEYKASSSTITIQDGPESGQTIPHVHVHVIPRTEKDLENNDEIYEKLQKHDKGDEVQWRTKEEMVEESLRLQKYFQKNMFS